MPSVSRVFSLALNKRFLLKENALFLLPTDVDFFSYSADLGYDSEIYANDQLVGAAPNPGGKYTQRSPPMSKGTNSRYIGLKVGIHFKTRSPIYLVC